MLPERLSSASIRGCSSPLRGASFRRYAAGTAALIYMCAAAPSAAQQTDPRPAMDHGAVRMEAAAPMHATGTFDVKLAPQTTAHGVESPSLARMSIDKQFHGDLEAISKGEMLAAGTSVKGSAGYVAIEQVSGTLHGRRGTFVLQHSGTMTRGAPKLVVSVVPDSGTGELEGLAGTMAIDIANGKHSYVFEYTLPLTR